MITQMAQTFENKKKRQLKQQLTTTLYAKQRMYSVQTFLVKHTHI
jgi:hypothetical protein